MAPHQAPAPSPWFPAFSWRSRGEEVPAASHFSVCKSPAELGAHTHSTHTYRFPLLWVRNRLRTRGTPRAASVVPAPQFQVCVPGPEGAVPGVSHGVCAGGHPEGLHPGSRGSPCPVLSTADEAHSREPERGVQGRREGEGALRVGPLQAPARAPHPLRPPDLAPEPPGPSLAYGPATSSAHHPQGDCWPMGVASSRAPAGRTGASETAFPHSWLCPAISSQTFIDRNCPPSY